MKSSGKLSKQDRIKFWSKHVKTYSSSGLTQRAYCREKNLSYWTFNNWKRHFDISKPASEFIEIPAEIKSSINAFNNNRESNNFEIILKNGLRILIPDTFNTDLFKQIITIAGELS